MTQRHSSRLLTVTGPAEAPLFEPFEARNTLLPNITTFINQVILFGYPPYVGRVFPYEPLSCNAALRHGLNRLAGSSMDAPRRLVRWKETVLNQSSNHADTHFQFCGGFAHG